jgi:CRISPR system Cascade subunit CasB
MPQIEAVSAASPERERPGDIVGRLVAVLGAEDYPTGDRAMLKRMGPGSPPPLAFYRFAYRHLPEGWEHRREDWMTLVAGLALLGAGGHRSDCRAGQVLAGSGYSEKRLERLLASEGGALHTLLLRAVRFLAAKGAAVNWRDFADLLGLFGDQDRGRTRIARDYFDHIRKLEQKKD